MELVCVVWYGFLMMGSFWSASCVKGSIRRLVSMSILC